MSALVSILVVFLGLLIIAAPILYFQARKSLREQKNFERGLKMVPMLIHLPPISEDIDGGGRDARDITEENISKSQIMYDIIASTMQKGFKHKFYGQRHFAFEIVGSKGFVYFYAAVPVVMVEVVKQAVVSAYPSARLEEVAEHNIFSPVGKISGTIGGELTLKQDFAYPIATFQDTKRDAMLSLLNSLSSLDKEDGVGIQILMRPAHDGWTKTATGHASKKRKGTEGKKGAAAAGGFLKTFVEALSKPPEHKGGGADGPQLSSLEQQTYDAIDNKTRLAGYETLIRVVASSNISQRADAILRNVVASFSLFDAPGKNGFKYTPAKDIERFVTAYILRFFPQENNRNILNSTELATIFHFPDQRSIPTSQLERQGSKQVDGPRNMAEDGILLGYNVFRGVKKPIRLSLEDRRRHMYVVGQTGVGKSVYLKNLALQDMIAGRGFAFVDPHGDVAEELLAMVPKERTEDVIYFSPADMDYPMGLNLFEFASPDQKDFLIQESINILYKLYDPNRQGMIGARFEHIFRNCALLLMADPKGGTFIDIPKLLIDSDFMKQKLQYVTDQNVLDFWTKEWPNSQRSNESGEVTSWVVSKFGAFLSNEMMRNIIGQTKSSFDLRDVMDNKKILLVNLSKGKTGDLNSKLMGMIFVMKFQAAAMSRANIAEDQRKDFCLYVDEFQNFSTDSFATILSEARKYRLNLIVANQFTTQLTDEIRDAVFGNAGTIVSFRVGSDADAESLSKKFAPVFDRDDILRIPNFNTVTQMLVGGIPTQPFSMATMAPLGTENPELGKALKQLSAAKHGRPKAVVEKEIFGRLATQEKPKPAFGSNPFGAAAPAGAARPTATPTGAKPPAGGSSFLDEWLAKRKTVPAAGAAGPSPQPQSPKPQAIATSAPTGPQINSQPTSAPTTPIQKPQPMQSNANISSTALEQQEVDTIATELKSQLGKPKTDLVQDPNDTIDIDNDGVLRIRE